MALQSFSFPTDFNLKTTNDKIAYLNRNRTVPELNNLCALYNIKKTTPDVQSQARLLDDNNSQDSDQSADDQGTTQTLQLPSILPNTQNGPNGGAAALFTEMGDNNTGSP